MDSKQNFCVVGRHKSETIDIKEYERVNKQNFFVKVREGKCDVCSQSESQIFTE